jgi:hypothetical protein
MMTWGTSFVKDIQERSEKSSLKDITCTKDVNINTKSITFLENKVKFVVENLGSIDIDSFVVRLIGSNGVESISAGGINAYAIQPIEVNFDTLKVGLATDLELIPEVTYEGEPLLCGKSSYKKKIEDEIKAENRHSCFSILSNNPGLSSGPFLIDPNADSIFTEVYCDMAADGGGYTMLKVNIVSQYNAAQAETYCSNLGMKLFVPRTPAHLASAYNLAKSGSDQNDRYLRILGIYPKVQGNRCVNIAFKDETCLGWSPRDNNGYWVSDSIAKTEPNGDNCLTGSMYYSWNADGSVNLYNDIACPGYTSERFMCDVGDKF